MYILKRMAFLFFMLLMSCAGRGKIQKTKDDKDMEMEKFYYEVSCSAPKLGPGEYLTVEYIGDSGTLRCFGNEIEDRGLATGYDGVCRSISDKYKLPKAIEAIWVSYSDRKVYYFVSLLPYDTIVELFKDAGAPCIPLFGDSPEGEFDFEKLYGREPTENELFIVNRFFGPENRCRSGLKCLDLCFLPGGKAVFYLKGPRKTVLLDWSATGEEVTDDEVLCHVYMTYGKKNMEEYYDVFYSDKFSDMEYWRKYMRDHGSAAPVLERYLERFNYTLEFEFEDENSAVVDVKADFANAERYSRTSRYNEAFKMPARLKEAWVQWHSLGLAYRCRLYFNDEECLRAYDEAFGGDRTQKGELRIKVGKYYDRYDIFLNVGEKSVKLEKTQVCLSRYPVDDPNSKELIFESYDYVRTNYFIDDKGYFE